MHRLRADKQRFTEEIDGVALRNRQVIAVAEATWTNKAMGADVLTDLQEFKLPALAQAGFTTAGADLILASRSGFTDGLIALAATTPNTHLIHAKDLLTDLMSDNTL